MTAETPQGVHPEFLMKALQEEVVQCTSAYLMSECGNPFAWTNLLLEVDSPRYRTSTYWGSLGHMSAGAVGAARVLGPQVVVLCGDGAMLTNAELHTAVTYDCPVAYIVMNDAGYGSCFDGHSLRGLAVDGLRFPRVDFSAYARSFGATGVRVEDERALRPALRRLREANGPFVLDVVMQPDVASPLLTRFQALKERDARSTKESGRFHVDD